MTDNFVFEDAVREAIPPLVCIAGPSGSGKTYTALRMATGMADGGSVFGIDTENRRMKLYAGDFAHKHLALDPPFHPDRYVGAIQAAVRGGAKAIVVDSASAEWEGIGGCQQIHDAAAKRFSDNKFAAWGVVTPIHQRFLDTLTHCPVPLVVTLRSKTAYEQDGKKIRKLGMQPIQRPGFEYEMPFWIDLDMDHDGIVTRSCWSEIQDQVYNKPGEELGASIAAWLDAGVGGGTERSTLSEWTAPAPKPFDGEAPTRPAEPEKLEMISLRKRIRQEQPNHPAVVDGTLPGLTLAELRKIVEVSA